MQYASQNDDVTVYTITITRYMACFVSYWQGWGGGRDPGIIMIVDEENIKPFRLQTLLVDAETNYPFPNQTLSVELT